MNIRLIPILWRYVLSGYIKIFLLSICSFIAILLVSRFKEVARFAALSESLQTTGLFIFYQIPLILPVALPISALLSAILLFQNLSKSFELTALRASGVRLSTILAPLLLFSLLCSFLNFSCAASLSPFCRRATKASLYYETTSNPLLLLQRQNLIKTKKSFVKMDEGSSESGVRNFFLITNRDSLSLVHAEQIWTEGENFKGKNIAVLSHFGNTPKEGFDSLLIENQSLMTTDTSTLSASLKKKRPHLDAGGLEFPMLRLRSMEKGSKGKKAFIEMGRRSSLSLAIFSFTLLGAAFSIQPGRTVYRRHLWIAISLAALLMLSYLLGKEFKKSPYLALFILLLPHPLIWGASLTQLYRVEKGVV